MSNMVVARRYARALYDVASGKGSEEKVGEDLHELSTVLRDNPKLMKVLLKKNVQYIRKKELISELFADGYGKESINFLHLLIEKKRIDAFDEIYSYYNRLMEMSMEQITAYVKTARELTEEQKTSLIDKLSKVMDKDVKLEIEIDQSLIGGISVRLEDKVIDGSIRGYLNKLRSYLDATDLYGAWKDGSDGK